MESVRFPSHGGLSVRSIFTFVLAVLITALFSVLLSSAPSAHAVDASWNGASIQYQGNQYILGGETTAQSTIPLDEGTSYYVYSPAPTSSSQNALQKAYVIYFAPGVSPPEATSANYVEYDYAPRTQTFSSPENTATISITPSSAANSGTTCALEGIGWIACPAMTWLADGMDNIFQLIAGFMEVQPLETGNTDGTLYQSWNVARSIANVAFIIVFLIIIYAQLTSVQVSSYGLKKLLPRLIIAAIGVNISFIIAAVAIDLSNILGYSVQSVFMGLQDQIATTGTVDPAAQAEINSGASWSAFTAFIISGGAAAGIGVVGAIGATGGTITALSFLLLPTLLGLILALLVAFLILAARQALIIILVIVAPLAIVAYLLPNTEKWFDKWRGLLMTMLIFFPAFAFVFGGAQLAGTIIIKNANSVTMQLLGMTVMVAPLFITPLILKFSGGVLGNIGRIVNNPNKGLLDRTRNWSKEQAEQHRKRGISNLDRRGNPIEGGLKRRNFARNTARRMDQRKRLNADRAANAETSTQTAYENSRLYNKYDMSAQKEAQNLDKEATHGHHEAHNNRLKATPGSMLHDRGVNAQSQKDYAEESQQRVSNYYNAERIRSGSQLNVSNNALETAKSDNQASEQNVSQYLDEQRVVRATQLGAAAERLESAKLNAEGAQSRYTAHIDDLKLEDASGTLRNPELHLAAQFAESGKEHAQAAQSRVQAMLNRERRTDGTILNDSTRQLIDAQLKAEASKSTTAVYINELKTDTTSDLHLQNILTEAAKKASQRSDATLGAQVEEYMATGEADPSASTALANAVRTLHEEQREAEVQRQRTGNAQKVQHEQFANALINDETLRERAGGINEQGADAALASSVNTVRSAYNTAVSEARSIIKHFNLSSGDRQKLALLSPGQTLTVTDSNGATYTFEDDHTYAREAAIEDQVAVGTIDQVEEIVMQSGSSSPLADYRTTIAEALAKNGLGSKSLYLGGKTIDDVGKGDINGMDDILGLAVETILKGKVSEHDLATIDPIAVGRLLDAAQAIKSGAIPALVYRNSPKLIPEAQDRLRDFVQIAKNTLVGRERTNIKPKARPYIEQISQL